MTLLRSGILIASSIIIFSLATMIITFSIISENNRITVKNHYAYSSPSSLPSTDFTLAADFNFVAVGDWGCTSDTIDTVKNIIDKDPEFVLALGDLSYNSSAQCWLDIIDPFVDKTMIAIGNHEVDSPKKLKDYMNFFGLKEQYYSFNYENIHFTVISTELPYEEGSEQYDFVNNDLSKVSSDPNIDWIIMYYHSLAYTSPADIGKGNRAEKDLRDIYHPLLEKYEIDLVLQAHNHNYQRSYPILYNNENSKYPIITESDNNDYYDPKGIIFATVGTGGASIYPLTGQSPYIAKQHEGFGFLNVDVVNDGKTLRGKFYANDGTTIKDQFTITKSTDNNVSENNR